jgi:heptosyltransferase-2
MSWKREAMEGIGRLSAAFVPARPLPKTESIVVLRNGDIGDLLVITPLFQALHQLFPHAQIVAAIGDWNVEVLKDNPYVSATLPLNAPWHNKFVKDQSVLNMFRYILFSSEVKELARRNFDIGIDILGSTLGSLLMLRARIPYRMGVRGFAGGDSSVQACVNYNPYEHVGRSALRFAEILGAKEFPPVYPQIFLSTRELEQGELHWYKGIDQPTRGKKRVVIGPGGGFVGKCWPQQNYVWLAKMLSEVADVQIMIAGSEKDQQIGRKFESASANAISLCGKLTLRETFALIASCDLVICNSSMLMHAAAAFQKASVVLLGESIKSTKQQAAQWGYQGSCHMFGKEADHQQIYTPTEALRETLGILGSVQCSSGKL